MRWVNRVAAWTVGWTAFHWWAVIGWPASTETAAASLVVLSGSSIVGLVLWYGWQHSGKPWRGP